jgi:hypothetical protein
MLHPFKILRQTQESCYDQVRQTTDFPPIPLLFARALIMVRANVGGLTNIYLFQ